MGGATAGHVVLGCIRKQTMGSKPVSSVPPHLLHSRLQAPALNSCRVFPWWIVNCRMRFLDQVALGCGVSPQQ